MEIRKFNVLGVAMSAMNLDIATQAVLEACAGETAQGIVDAIFEAVTAFEGRAAQHDDLTAVAVTFRG